MLPRALSKKKTIKPIYLGLIASFVLTGCASLSEEECLTAEWYSIGYEDGLRGRPEGRMGDHREACADYGITLDPAEYLRGHDDGVRQFCLPANGYRVGLAGRRIQVSCPAELSYEFNESYQYGKRIYVVERQYRNHGRTLEQKRNTLKQVHSQQSQIEKQLIDTGVYSNLPGAFMGRSKSLIRKAIQLETEIAELEADWDDEQAGQVVGHNNGNVQGNSQGSSQGQSRGNSLAHRQDNSRGNAQGHRQNNSPGNSQSHSQGHSQGDKSFGNHGRSQGEYHASAMGRKAGHNKVDPGALKRKQQELASVRNTIQQLDSEMDRRYSAREERRKLLQENRRLIKEEGQLETEIHMLEWKRQKLRNQAQYLRQNVPFAW